jgi:exopolysaccharide biosynthesis protein
MVVEQGRVTAGTGEDNPEPRTAVALDKAAKKLIIVVVDGRQPGYSEGVTLAELGEIILENEGYFGMNLDGGGSTTLVKEGRFGEADVLNTPIDHRIPGWERPVGNHLGIRATSK